MADTSLLEVGPTNNHGGQPWVNSGTTQNGPRTRGLFRFDLTTIPTNAIVQSATLVLAVTGQPAEPPPSAPFGLYRMLRPWGEGDKVADGPPGYGQGLPADAGEATWLYAFYPTNAWSAPGGAFDADFSGIESSFQVIYGIAQSPYYFDSTPELVADVQGWVNDPHSNFGWMLLCHDEDTRFTARRFASRQDSNNPPALEIEYIVPARIDLVEQTGTQFNLSFVAQAGQTYSVEFRDSLVSGNWQSLTNIAAPPETMRVFVTNTISSAQRSYRVTTQ